MKPILAAAILACGVSGLLQTTSAEAASLGRSAVAPAHQATNDLVQVQHHHHHRYDYRRHGPRYHHYRPGYTYFYGGYYYAWPWWLGVGPVVPPPAVYAPPPPPPPAPVYRRGRAHVDWCFSRYRSYDPVTDTYLGYDGYRHRCISPY